MTALELLNELLPNHDRTSCSDGTYKTAGNLYPHPDNGYPRCSRCAILYRIEHGEWKDSFKVNTDQNAAYCTSISINFTKKEI